jgi:hypothetical protein
MLQLACVVLAITTFVLGIRGFTARGIRLDAERVLRGKTGQVTGALLLAFAIAILAFAFLALPAMFPTGPLERWKH